MTEATETNVMTIEALEALVLDQASFRKAFRKTNSEILRGKRLGIELIVENAGAKNEVVELLAGKFSKGRTPYIHQVTLPSGAQIRLKFYDTVKQILNSKGKEVPGKESFLSYLEVTVIPFGAKAYCFTVDVNQVVWGTSKSGATAKHATNLTNLIGQATELGIDLSEQGAWATVYSENY
jgi:hypothetical protein